MPRDAALLQRVFRQLAAEGVAVVITGHEAETILEIAHSVLWLTEGTTRVLGTPDDARRNDAFAREYLGPLALRGGR